MYILAMDEWSVSAARGRLAEIIDHTRTVHEPVYLSRHGTRVAAVIAVDDLHRLISLAEDAQDLLDATAARAEMQETRATPIPWDDVKRDLGLA